MDSFKYSWLINTHERLSKELQIDQTPLAVFLYALKAPESIRQYPRRLKVFLDYLHLAGDSEEQAIEFVKRVTDNPKWLQDSFMNFVLHQKERVKNKEISEGTIGNYYKAVKLFCEMNFDHPVINWKKVARGMPRARKFALDRIPTIEEIRKLCEFPDRRIKPIIYTMISSGIRVLAVETHFSDNRLQRRSHCCENDNLSR